MELRLRLPDRIGNTELLPYAINARPTTGGAYQFPEAASFRISFSSVRSDTALRRRAFSASRSFSLLTWSLFSPPYSLRHLMGWTALPSALRLRAWNWKENHNGDRNPRH
jgi:hypothetical protein